MSGYDGLDEPEADDQEAHDRWLALGIRIDIPHPARVYDYMLGRKVAAVQTLAGPLLP